MSATLSPQQVRVFLFGVHKDSRKWILETFQSQESPIQLEVTDCLAQAEIVIVEDTKTMEAIAHLNKDMPVLHLAWNSPPERDSLIFRIEAQQTTENLIAQMKAATQALHRQSVLL
jgi:hypothetical protein